MRPSSTMATMRLLSCLILIAILPACEPTANDASSNVDQTNTPAQPESPLADQIAAVQRGESTRINVSTTTVTVDDVAPLASLDSLTHLVLNNTDVTDVAMPPLAALPKLEFLKITSPHVTDEGLASISRNGSLRFLIIQNAAITDNGLLQLKGMEQLESLYLLNTKVTEQGVAALGEHLPGLHIHW